MWMPGGRGFTILIFGLTGSIGAWTLGWFMATLYILDSSSPLQEASRGAFLPK